MFSLQGRCQHGLVPENSPAPSVKAEQNAVLALRTGAHGENAVTPHNRRSVAVAGDFGAPDQIAGRTPVDRDAGFQAGAVATWPAPSGPVLGRGQRQSSEDRDAKNGTRQAMNHTRLADVIADCLRLPRAAQDF